MSRSGACAAALTCAPPLKARLPAATGAPRLRHMRHGNLLETTTVPDQPSPRGPAVLP
ncbi:hypothetical protein [Streptomyces sp. NPDC097981]|uniref:hypothetical protein n=1 Tax=Streptomyces sp. NPDC097981 TaxID=3155428 RepID=UPI00331BAFC2